MTCISIKQPNTLLIKNVIDDCDLLSHLTYMFTKGHCLRLIVSLFRQTAGAVPRPHGLLHLQHGEFFCPLGVQHLSEGLIVALSPDSGCRRWATVRG